MKFPIAICAVAALTACAKPALDIAEPSGERRTEAQAVLKDTTLGPVPTTRAQDVKPRVARLLYRVRASSYRVCKNLKLEAARCGAIRRAPVRVSPFNRTINASADLYDNVRVFGGLVASMNDVELAAVVAHEFAHVMYGHVQKKVRNALIGMSIAGGLAAAYGAATRTDPNQYGRQWANIGLRVGSVAYSPEMEIEADRTAIYVMKHAGFPATAMRDAIVRLHRATTARRRGLFSPGRVGFLQTHPSNDRRIAHIMSAIDDAEAGVPLKAAARQ